MVFIAKFVAVAMTVMGCVAFMKPEVFRNMLDIARRENMIYAFGALKAVLGILLIVASSECAIPWLVALFGWVAAAGGILGIAVKKDLMNAYFKWLEEKDEPFYKRVSIAVLCMGVLLIYAI